MGKQDKRIIKWLICVNLALLINNTITLSYFQNQTVLFQTLDIDKVNFDNSTQANNRTNCTCVSALCGNIDEVALNAMKDDVVDAMLTNLTLAKIFPAAFKRMSLHDLARSLGAVKRNSASKLMYYANITSGPEDPNWKKVHFNIRQFSLYDPDDPAVDGVLHDLTTLPITRTGEINDGTQFKLLAYLENGGKAIIKPMRYARELEANPNQFVFDDMERHTAEIAAFQLDKLLGFYRVPPTRGRKINITSELMSVFPQKVNRTVFVSPSGNTCFFGECFIYCDSAHAICGNPDTIEVSMMSFLPDKIRHWPWYQPYKGTYHLHNKAYWEKHTDLCDKLKQQHPFNNGKLLADMIDAHTFDFLTDSMYPSSNGDENDDFIGGFCAVYSNAILCLSGNGMDTKPVEKTNVLQGNGDRHSFMFFNEFNNYSFPIMIDNGKGFGRTKDDTMSILTPLRQCCMIRKSTLLKYVKIYQGSDKLSDLMEKALANDPVAPVLLRGHLNALDRRLLKILRIVAKCLETNKISDVIIDDGF